MENCCKKQEGMIYRQKEIFGEWVEGFCFIFSSDNDESFGRATYIVEGGNQSKIRLLPNLDFFGNSRDIGLDDWRIMG